MRLSASITNADNIKLGIRNIGHRLPDVDNADVKDAMEKAAKLSIPYDGGNSYAVPETGGGYERTGNLGRSVMVWQRGASTVIEVEAYRRGRKYDPYVIGDRDGGMQAEIHQGRWITMRDAVDYQLDDLIEKIDDDNQTLINQELG